MIRGLLIWTSGASPLFAAKGFLPPLTTGAQSARACPVDMREEVNAAS
jgi:hypothetical protein